MKVLLSLAMAVALPLASATFPQSDYPACAINHEPEYWCCNLGTAKGAEEPNQVLFTKFNRPTGDGITEYYKEGWAKARRINWVAEGELSMYQPDSPEYDYSDPNKICRLQSIVKNAAESYTMQCTFDPSGDYIYTKNESLAEDSQDDTVFWTSTPNPRNNNASFPIGAVCTSLMLEGGKVNTTAKGLCTSPYGTSKYRFTTFTEGPIVLHYVVVGVCLALIALWTVGRMLVGTRTPAPLTSIEDGTKKLLDNRGGPQTPVKSLHGPSLAMRATEVQLRNSVEDVVQTGYSSSIVGKAVFGYLILVSLLLNIPVILVILDNNGHHYMDGGYNAWFDSTNVVINVFIVLWVVCSVWFGTIVFFKNQIVNFFRIPTGLDTCTYVRMFKPEVTEVLLADRSGISALVVRVESILFPNAKHGVEETVPVRITSDGARYIEFQHLRYTFDEVEAKFIPGSVILPDTFDKILADSQGLSSAEHIRRLDIVGRNAIEVEMPSIIRSIVDEVFSLFYVYQLMCYYSWYFTAYYWVGALNTAVIVIAAGVNIYTKREMFASIVRMTHYESNVDVNRDGAWVTVKSSDLVPGDLVRVAENWELPCDMIVVKGSTVCDESMLTGESMPVQKFPVPNDSSDLYVSDGTGKKHTLFAGTKSLASGRNEDILGVVQSTGAHTSRGQLVQSILYPAPIRFKYDEHLKAVFAFLFVFAFIAAYFAMKFLISNAGVSNNSFSFVYGMFMFSAVLNPLLPVVITIGQVNGAKRLIKQQIFCLNPQRITLCGKVRVFCFDKTGTITKEGLDYLGCVPVSESAFSESAFLEQCTDMTDASLNSTMKYALASCHSVGSLQGELVGNEVEVKMFKSTQWKLIEAEGQQPIVQAADGSDELVVVKRFNFDHHRMSMSVVMKHVATGKLYVFCKGSYEKMESVSIASSVPSNYKEVAENLAKEGCYVLGMTYKEVPELSESDLAAFLADRDAVEKGLSLLGLILFRNELKEDSRETLLTLKKGDVRCVMITGDNALTGCYIARTSGMVDDEAHVILGDMVADEATGSALVWKDVDSQTTYSFDQVRAMAADVELAVTGKAFDYLVKMGEIKNILFNIRIFSRMTPSGKVECVKLHMAAGAVTGMCGDGGNDCGALRIAHVGVALSEAEASVVSPFTSKTKSLASVVDLILEGRGALATSFGSVKYLMMYGLIGIGCRFVMYYNGVFISQFGFMFLDGAILVGISYAITRSRPQKKLGTQRPTSSLVGPTTLVSLAGAWVIHILFLYGGIHHVMNQTWYCPFNPANVNLVHWWELQDSNLGSSLWFLVCFQQMVTGLTTSLGSKFRLPLWHNKSLMFYYTLLFVFLVVVFVGPPNRVGDQLRVASSTNVVTLPDIPLPSGFRWELLAIGLGNTLAAVGFEYFVILGPVRTFFRNRFHKDVLKLKM